MERVHISQSEVIASYKEFGCTETCKKFGISAPLVYKILKKNNVELKIKNQPRNKRIILEE
jgi:hypothetical protein